ncbi:MAG: hypothetical protein IKR51_05280, partial [Oscillospiraceae bacterium]|nr:hypothetical protein [Oscillospiraceae bacterium]
SERPSTALRPPLYVFEKSFMTSIVILLLRLSCPVDCSTGEGDLQPLPRRGANYFDNIRRILYNPE